MDDQTISGTLNFRSVPAYSAANGRIRPHALYRCGAFDDIDPLGLAQLKDVGLTSVFDLRSHAEKKRRPSPLLDQADFHVVTYAHNIRHGDLYAVLKAPGSDPDAAIAAMKAVYAGILDQFGDVFKLLFRTMVENPLPLAIHCTAGKDRTGIAIALILEFLGVRRDDIFEDYLKSRDARHALFERFRSRNQGLDFGAVEDRLIEPVVDANPDYLKTMFTKLDADVGGIEVYARDRLALTSSDRDKLVARLTY